MFLDSILVFFFLGTVFDVIVYSISSLILLIFIGCLLLLFRTNFLIFFLFNLSYCSHSSDIDVQNYILIVCQCTSLLFVYNLASSSISFFFPLCDEDIASILCGTTMLVEMYQADSHACL